MSLYQKHRPKDLKQIKGNKAVISTLGHLLSNLEKCPHSFLLTGETGCGKTTLGRIIAKRLEVNGSDFREIDSAHFRGIETIREIRKQSQYMPLESERRVWLIDECHKMTGDAQNALLKILEDPPKHVYFVLCTTEPQKLLPTIKGRCSTFQVTTLSEEQIIRLLKRIARAEEVKLNNEIYEQIANDSLGHPRNAINILEQVISTPEDERLQIAKKAAEEQSQTIELCRILLSNVSWRKVYPILNGLKQQDPESIRRAVLGYCQAVLLKSDNPKAGLIIEEFMEPFYNTGFPGLVYACYAIIKS